MTCPTPDFGLSWHIDYGPQVIELLVALSGDYNHDGVVDAADYTVWRDANGQAGVGIPADGTGDGRVDAADHAVWLANFGRRVPIASVSVPEPTAAALVLVAAWSSTPPRAAGGLTTPTAAVRAGTPSTARDRVHRPLRPTPSTALNDPSARVVSRTALFRSRPYEVRGWYRASQSQHLSRQPRRRRLAGDPRRDALERLKGLAAADQGGVF